MCLLTGSNTSLYKKVSVQTGPGTATLINLDTQRTSMAQPELYDGAHASMLEAYIRAKTREGYRLLGTEVPYRRGRGFGYVDVVMECQTDDGATTQLVVAELKTVIFNLGRSIRQVNAAKEAFLASRADLVDNRPSVAVDYPLVVWASKSNIQCLSEFAHVLADTTIEIFHEDQATAESMSSRLEIQRAVLSARAGLPRPSSPVQQARPHPPAPQARPQAHYAQPAPGQQRLYSSSPAHQQSPREHFLSWRFSQIRTVRKRPYTQPQHPHFYQ